MGEQNRDPTNIHNHKSNPIGQPDSECRAPKPARGLQRAKQSKASEVKLGGEPPVLSSVFAFLGCGWVDGVDDGSLRRRTHGASRGIRDPGRGRPGAAAAALEGADI
ncbi:hypothetical protein GWK47_047525 [Chionoecetes opilio]|uniref:Uncharacterized protein n=1 Tax=Chionoecetes opilio TaxID=41210 RepID=A0A8J4Y658_CHIOP|nr:hypothetical protein GWK47_047525 [Chionoecetes opilio]